MDIDEEIKSAMPAVMARVKREALERIEREAVNAATEVAVKAARDWTVENIVPEIRAQLEAGKAGMVATAEKTAEAIGEALKTALVAQAEKTCTQSHTLNDIVQKLFRGY